MNKSFIFVLITLALFATATSSFNTPVLKKSLYLRDWGRTFYNIFRTNNATISFSTDHPDFLKVDPTYRVLGFGPSTVTEIIRDISSQCDKKGYIYSRLTYYENTDSLLYFCYNNKSLLVLDSSSYKVQRSIPLTFDFPYLEMARLYPENDSLVILLINSGFDQGTLDSFNSTVFIRVNLTSQQVIQNFVLKSGFAPTESVVAYAGNGTSSYILTYNYNELLKNFTVYAFNSTGNNYTITRSLYNETFDFSQSTFNDIYSQLYVAGDLVMTSNNDSILFLNSQGQLISKAENLTLECDGWRRNPTFFEGRNKVFYFGANDTIFYFTIRGSSIDMNSFGSGTQLQIARGTSQKGDQLFFLQQHATYDDSYWFVYDIDTLKIISQVPCTYNDIFTTNVTYGILNNKTISLFAWNNDTFLGQVKILQNDYVPEQFYYYDSENSLFYYLRSPQLSSKCDFVQVDIRTGAQRNVTSVNGATVCLGRITQVNSTSLDFVIEDRKGGYYVNSGRFGQVNFTYTFEILTQGFAIFNFNDLSLHLINYNLPSTTWIHSFQTFDNRSRAFTEQNISVISGLSDFHLHFFTYLGGSKVLMSEISGFFSIDLETNVATNFYLDYTDSRATKLVGDNGDEGFIITDKEVYSGIPYYYNPEANTLGSLPTESALARDARASGRCKYFQSNGYYMSETVIDFYDICEGKASFPRSKYFRVYTQ